MMDCCNLTFGYGRDQNVFEGVSFSIKEGECVVLTGPSGCGKSTLAYCLTGLYPEYAGNLSGKVMCEGRDIHKLEPHRRAASVSMLFQNPDDQFCMDTPEAEIVFALENIKFEGDADARVDELLDFTQMAHHKNAPFYTLSGGMKQKVALSTAMATEPKLIILDEPFANIDPDSIDQIIPRIKKLNREQGAGILIIDHKTEHWSGIANRLMVMDKGGKIIGDEYVDTIKTQKEVFEEYGIERRYTVNEDVGIHNAKPVTIQDAHAMKIKDLTISYKDKPILDAISFNVPKGSITTITGENGSGKTSLLWALAGLAKPAGLLRPDGGIDTDGSIGIVFQSPGYQFLTQRVKDEIEISLKQSNTVDDGRIEDKTLLLLEEFGLDHKAMDSPYTLSMGQQRRLGVLAMLACGKDILLLDEPTYGQDSETTEFIMYLIKSKVEKGLTAVISTHDMDLVRRYSDLRIMLSDRGVAKCIN